MGIAQIPKGVDICQLAVLMVGVFDSGKKPSQLRRIIQDEIATALVMTVKIVARCEHRKDDKGSAEISS